MEKRKIQNSVYVLETKPNPALPLGLALCFPKGDCVCEELLAQAGLRGRKSRERRTEGSAAVVGSSEPLLGAAVTLETTQWMGRLGRRGWRGGGRHCPPHAEPLWVLRVSVLEGSAVLSTEGVGCRGLGGAGGRAVVAPHQGLRAERSPCWPVLPAAPSPRPSASHHAAWPACGDGRSA